MFAIAEYTNDAENVCVPFFATPDKYGIYFHFPYLYLLNKKIVYVGFSFVHMLFFIAKTCFYWIATSNMHDNNKYYDKYVRIIFCMSYMHNAPLVIECTPDRDKYCNE